MRIHPALAMAAALAALTAACGPRPSASPAPAPSASAGMDVLADSLDPFVRGLVADGFIPGVAIAVVTRDGPAYLRGFGVRDVHTREPVTPETGFYIASSTKSFTGMLAAILDQRGVISLDAPLSRYLPELRMNAPLSADSITLRALLTHTSGLRNDAVVFRTAFSGDHDDAMLVRLLGQSTPIPRTYRYDNLGYVVAALAMERATGREWQDLLRDELFRPLGMMHTTARISEARAAGWPLASPHLTGADSVVRLTMEKQDNTMHPAGGMVTTAGDLVRWLQAQLNEGRVDGRQVVPQAVVRAAHTPHAMHTDTFYRYVRTGYGLGWQTADYEGERMVHHFGGFQGWQAHVSFLPDRGIGVVVLINDSSPIGGPAPDLIATCAYDLLLGRPGVNARYAAERERLVANAAETRQRIRADWERRAARPPTPDERKPFFAGTYENEMMGTLDVRLRDNRELWATLGNLSARLDPFTRPDALRVELLPGSGQPVLFFFRDDRTPADSANLNGMVFRRRPGG
ncbi:MAG TPA: serine hydrolase domain-containing protein [Longimicrobium sp.]|jgi:CubicO group peptidase (beta-lactamase class C family)|uniref:serine hydrolase domain-containing protein n=1 Tax=Longimicrobium sp. TaxID=2029185 RepID=UPI002EDB9CEF